MSTLIFKKVSIFFGFLKRCRVFLTRCIKTQFTGHCFRADCVLGLICFVRQPNRQSANYRSQRKESNCFFCIPRILRYTKRCNGQIKRTVSRGKRFFLFFERCTSIHLILAGARYTLLWFVLFTRTLTPMDCVLPFVLCEIALCSGAS